MYKLLLSWKYLLTRYLALASIVSVMLGVATLIVVNSVMGGFASKLKGRMRGLQADILIEARSMHNGFANYQDKIRWVQDAVGDKVESITPLIETIGMIQFRYRGEMYPRMVKLVGIDPETKSQVGDLAKYLLNPANQRDPAKCFEVRVEEREYYQKGDYQSRDREGAEPVFPLPRGSGVEGQWSETQGPPPPEPPPALEIKPYGAVIGYSIATYRNPEAKVTDKEKDISLLDVGDEVLVTTLSRSETEGHDDRRGTARPVAFRCVITDLFKSGMSEYDSNLVFIDLKDMQQLRTMYGRATSLHIKLKDYDHDAKEVVQVLARKFDHRDYAVSTWEEKAGNAIILAAIANEGAILNIVLFLIIAVAGFGILAIFFMMVVEKIRDIGILKALGASNLGVMGIFLSYGLALGLVGAGLGTALGVSITLNINEIEQLIATHTGREVFPRDIYYFDSIPTDMKLRTIFFVNLGALLIAVGASVLPSLRAAMLHPVRALRYE